MINSIVKAVSIRAGADGVVFHLEPEAYKWETFRDKPVQITVLLPISRDKSEQWTKGLIQYFNTTGTETNFRLMKMPETEERNVHKVMDDFRGWEESAELVLRFHWPLPLLNGVRKLYSLQDFIHTSYSRIQRIFGLQNSPQPVIQGNIHFLSHFQSYQKQAVHISKSSADRQKQWLHGFTGPVYINGEFAPLFPLLALCSEWHAGNELSNSMGFFTLEIQPRPYFETLLGNEALLNDSIGTQLGDSDSFQSYVAGYGDLNASRQHLREKLGEIIKTGQYQPQAANATIIPKPGSGKRVIEQLQTDDEILQHFLYELIKEPFDRLLSNDTIGFRKGFSTKKAAELLEEAIGEGYAYMVHTDIEDFFPSIDHRKLEACIRNVLPKADERMYRLLVQSITIPVLIRQEQHPREKGIAQGSSLSPLLANLYLDAFDEYVSSLSVRIIRYADDMLILCKTEEEAKKVLDNSIHFLQEWGLRLQADKTSIGKTTDPFHFLGLSFDQGKLLEPDAKQQSLKKKPVFITEPYVYLSFHKQAMLVHQHGKLQNSVPLDSIASVILHYQVVISGILISKCLQAAIPITLTLSNAYHLTTIKPNTKTYHDTLTLHGISYYNLSEGEKLFIAQRIAIAKFGNILPLFRQRYQQGTSGIIAFFEAGITRITGAQSLDEVRGHEGQLTRQFYSYLNELIEEEDFILHKRDHNGKDPMNGLLNFSSYLLMAKINSILRTLGLNPYLGFLHSSANRYESLVFDIMELFRGRLYRFLLRVIHLKIIQFSDFEQTEKGIFLNNEARKRFIRQWERELNSIDKLSTLTLREQLYAQVVIIKNWACEQKNLNFYTWNV